MPNNDDDDDDVEWFQALIGDRYGKLFLQERIPTSVFKVFLDIAKDMKVLHSHLLDELYELDENAVPPVYALKVCNNSRGRLEFFKCCFFHTLHLVLHFSVPHLIAPFMAMLVVSTAVLVSAFALTWYKNLDEMTCF